MAERIGDIARRRAEERANRRHARHRPAPGRRLAEFLPLGPAEQTLLDHVRAGTPATVGPPGPPRAMLATPARSVRAAFVRFLALGGDDVVRCHERGVALAGAVIVGPLNLAGCTVERNMVFVSCRFEDPINVANAQLRNLVFAGTQIPGFRGDGCVISRSLQFRASSRCDGEFRMVGARIEGQISFNGSEIVRIGKEALVADQASTEGSVSFRKARVFGEVRLHGARIKGSLICSGAKFYNRRGKCLTADRARIDGTVHLDANFSSIGSVRFVKAVVGGSFTCVRASFSNRGRVALEGQSLEVTGGFVWRDLKRVRGTVGLMSATVADLVDDQDSWFGSEGLRLDGFRYARISGSRSTVDPQARIRWLKHHTPQQGAHPFLPQPWEHLTRILREMGHKEGAKQVAIAKQEALRDANLIGQRPIVGVSRPRRWLNTGINDLARLLHVSYGLVAGYGYRPLRTLAWMAAVWLLCSIAYAAAAHDGLFGPTNPRIYADSQFNVCGDGGEPFKENWTDCKAVPPEHTTFSSLMYSLDVILPLVDLKQEADWAPIVTGADGAPLPGGGETRLLMWLEILFGWIGSLLLVSVVGRLIERD